MLNKAEDFFLKLDFFRTFQNTEKKYMEQCIAVNREWESLGQKSNHEHRC